MSIMIRLAFIAYSISLATAIAREINEIYLFIVSLNYVVFSDLPLKILSHIFYIVSAAIILIKSVMD